MSGTTGTNGTNGAIYRFDYTIFAEPSCEGDLVKWCKEHCKKWGFQGEICPTTGKHHFQMRISLKKKARKPPFIPFDGKFSPTSKAIDKDNFYDYVSKDESKVGEARTDLDEPIYVPRQIREIEKLYPWQQEVIDKSKVWNTRHINWIYCPNGNIGKSILAGYVRAHKLGRVLPMVNDYKELMEVVCDMPTSSFYILDMPRAIKKDKLNQLYSAIETIKDGYAFDRRYSFKEKVFDCPNIWIFSNTQPDKKLLSSDRWVLWQVKENQLVKFESEGVCLIDDESKGLDP